jgi:hypothetical protein
VFIDTATAAASILGGTMSGNAASGAGGALYARAARTDTKPALTVGLYVVIENNSAGAEGGGAALLDARARFNTAIVRFNSAPSGGGIAASLSSGSPITNAGEPVLTFIEGSIRENSAGTGAGVHLTDARAFFSGPAIRFNRAAGDGGGVRAVATRADVNNFVRFYAATFDSNKVRARVAGWPRAEPPRGAPMLLAQGLRGSAWSLSNAAPRAPAPSSPPSPRQAANGGGLSLANVRLSMNASFFYDNAAAASGGGLHVNTSNVLDPSAPAVAIGTTTFGRNSVRGAGRTGAWGDRACSALAGSSAELERRILAPGISYAPLPPASPPLATHPPQAVQSGGAGFFLNPVPGSNPAVRMALFRNLVQTSTAVTGGAFYVQDIGTSLQRNTFKGNQAIPPAGRGGAFFYRASPGFTYSSVALSGSKAGFNANNVGGARRGRGPAGGLGGAWCADWHRNDTALNPHPLPRPLPSPRAPLRLQPPAAPSTSSKRRPPPLAWPAPVSGLPGFYAAGCRGRNALGFAHPQFGPAERPPPRSTLPLSPAACKFQDNRAAAGPGGTLLTQRADAGGQALIVDLSGSSFQGAPCAAAPVAGPPLSTFDRSWALCQCPPPPPRHSPPHPPTPSPRCRRERGILRLRQHHRGGAPEHPHPSVRG